MEFDTWGGNNNSKKIKEHDPRPNYKQDNTQDSTPRFMQIISTKETLEYCSTWRGFGKSLPLLHILDRLPFFHINSIPPARNDINLSLPNPHNILHVLLPKGNYEERIFFACSIYLEIGQEIDKYRIWKLFN